MINLRCLYCQTPFTVGRVEMLKALIIMDEKNQNHHDAHCPRCKRANSVSRQRMELFFPNWRDAAKQARTDLNFLKNYENKQVPTLKTQTISALPASKKKRLKADSAKQKVVVRNKIKKISDKKLNVFLCYSHADKPSVRKLYKKLKVVFKYS